MIKSESITELAKALSAAQAEMPAVTMDSVNPYYKSKYASLGAVIRDSRPVLVKYGLSLSQIPVSTPGQIGIETILMHTSGEWVSNTVLITCNPDAKNPAQEAGIIISYLRRYGWSAVLGLYTEEDTDGNEVTAPPKQVKLPSWTAPQVTAAMETKKFSNEFDALGAMKHSLELKPGVTGVAGVAFWSIAYRKHRDLGLTPEKAAVEADWEYVQEKERKTKEEGAK